MKSLVLAALVASAIAFLPAHADPPAVFEVGFATRNIDPVNPQWPGGFGEADYATKDLLAPDDHLEVRVMAIKRGSVLVEFAIVDTQGWFAGQQEGPYGSRDARLHAAEVIDDTLPAFTEANIIVSSTHSHAAPSIMGIWGPPDPVYLQAVHDATVDALVAAASGMQPAHLYAGEADTGAANVSAVSQTDGYQGWSVDGRTPILWARHPQTGATLGLYANIPIHADVINGADLERLSADHIGYERRALEQQLGGTAVIAMGTLGRQESIIQVRGPTHSQALSSYVVNAVDRALAAAQPITDGSLGAAEQYALVPATNPLLTVLNEGNLAGPVEPADAGIWTINRSVLPPYVVGPNVGFWVTAFRIGDLVYATQPGEAFPEVSTAIRRTFDLPDDQVRIVGMAQDQLGYYYPPETYVWTYYNSSDHHIYNASLLLGEANVKAHALNALALGFTPDAGVHETSQFDDVEGSTKAGVQFFPLALESANPAFTFDVRVSDAALYDVPSAVLLGEGPGFQQGVGPITWSFGDGSPPVATGQFFVTHTFPAALVRSTYTVTATVTDPHDPQQTISWTQQIVVDPPATATVAIDGDKLTAGETGGQGIVIAAHWTFSDNTSADGLTVTRPASATGTVTIVDGAGNSATAAF